MCAVLRALVPVSVCCFCVLLVCASTRGAGQPPPSSHPKPLVAKTNENLKTFTPAQVHQVLYVPSHPHGRSVLVQCLHEQCRACVLGAQAAGPKGGRSE